MLDQGIVFNNYSPERKCNLKKWGREMRAAYSRPLALHVVGIAALIAQVLELRQ
jgi:hypothetical protein